MSAPAHAGYTAPAETYARMRRMEAESAAPLLSDLRKTLPESAPLRAAYEAWYKASWSPFYERFAGPDASLVARVEAAALTSDAVALKAEGLREELEDFYRTVLADVDKTGLVPTGRSPLLTEPADPPGPNPIVVGTAAAAALGAGVLAYHLTRRALRKK